MAAFELPTLCKLDLRANVHHFKTIAAQSPRVIHIYFPQVQAVPPALSIIALTYGFRSPPYTA